MTIPAPIPAVSEKSQHWYIVDGSGFIFRAFYAIPMLTRGDGIPVNAVYGFCNMLIKAMNMAKDGSLCVIFDTPQKNFRHELYDQYKANRDAPPPELAPQFGLIRQACDAFGVQHKELAGYEADDLIATLARQAQSNGQQCTIISSDKDLFQLLSNNINIYDPMKERYITTEIVHEKFGVGVEHLTDVMALCGDKSDNVPGVPSIGPKTAAALITQYGSLEALLQNTHTIKQAKRKQVLEENKDLALLSRKLIRLDEQVPVNLNDIEYDHSIDGVKLLAFLQQQNFRSMINKVKQLNFITQDDINNQAHTQMQTDNNASQYIRNANATQCCEFIAAIDNGHVAMMLYGNDGQQALVFANGNKVISCSAINEITTMLIDLLQNPAMLKIVYNAKHMLHQLSKIGCYDYQKNSLAACDDVMLMSYCANGNKFEHTFVNLMARYCQMMELNDDVCLHTQLLLQVHDKIKADMIYTKTNNLYHSIEKPLLPILTRMEHAGIKINVSHLQKMGIELTAKCQQLEQQIYKIADCEFNIGSPKQLSEILFERMNLLPAHRKRGKSGNLSTNSEILELIASHGHEIADLILNWRHLSKLLGTYIETLPTQIDENDRIHTTYSMTTVMTGRLSSLNPNLQNIPIRGQYGPEIRKAFVADEGNSLISLDYSQIELRLFAHVADVTAMITEFKQGHDIHRATAAQVFHVNDIADVTQEMRAKAKAINFGIIYGMSGFGLAKQLKVSQHNATNYINSYLEYYPQIQQYMDHMGTVVKEDGYVSTLFGRRCHMESSMNNANNGNKVNGHSMRQAINAPIQGLAADIIKQAMIAIDDFIADEQLPATMLCQVHDELIFEAPSECANEIAGKLSNIMTNVIQLKVPLETNINVGKSWGKS